MVVFDKNFLSGKTALVTGGSRGIGRDIAINLAKYGAYVFINYNNSENSALEVKSEIEKFDGKCEILKFDVANNQELTSSPP